MVIFLTLLFTIHILFFNSPNLCTAEYWHFSAIIKYPKAPASKVACYWCGDISAYDLKQKFKKQDFNLLGKSKIIREQREDTHRQLAPLFSWETSGESAGMGRTFPTLSLCKLFLMHSPDHVCNRVQWAVEMLSRQHSFLTRRRRQGVTGIILWHMKLSVCYIRKVWRRLL